MATEDISREGVIKHIISTFIEKVGFLNDEEKYSVNEKTDIIKDFNVDGDDASFIIMELEKYFKIDAAQEEWAKVSRIYEIADLIIKHVNEKSS